MSASEQTQDSYAYSMNEEDYTGYFATREEAIAEGDEMAWDGKRDEFWTGRAVPWEPTVWADGVIERLQEQAYDDNNPELMEGWLTRVTPEQSADLTARLTAAFMAWATEHKHRPDWFTVDDVQRHKTTPQEEETAHA